MQTKSQTGTHRKQNIILQIKTRSIDQSQLEEKADCSRILAVLGSRGNAQSGWLLFVRGKTIPNSEQKGSLTLYQQTLSPSPVRSTGHTS
jgi:hypothetical protein